MTTTSEVALTDDAVTAALLALPGWQYAEGKITKVFQNSSYVNALAFVQRVGQLAEEQDHHPDIALTWPTTTVTYWTHTLNGVGPKDIAAALCINEWTP